MFWLWADSKYIFISCFYFTIFNASILPSLSPSPINSWSVWKGPGAHGILSPLFSAEDQMYSSPLLRAWWRDRSGGSAEVYGPAPALAHREESDAGEVAAPRGQNPGGRALGARPRCGRGAMRGSRRRGRPRQPCPPPARGTAARQLWPGVGLSPCLCGCWVWFGGLLLFVVVCWSGGEFNPQNRSWGRFPEVLHCWQATLGKEFIGLN